MTQVQKGINDLKTWALTNNAQFLLEEWDYEKNGHETPETITYGSNKKVWWRCPASHSYASKIGNRTFLDQGCPYCCGSKVLEGFNDLKTWCHNNNKQYLLDEWDYEKNELEPSNISPHNHKKVWWKCSLGHNWEATIGSRTSDQRPGGCPYCSNPPKKVMIGFNDFETWCRQHGKDNLLQEWNYNRNNIQPKDITYGAGKKVWWKCSRGHEWCVSAANRVQGTGCPVCARTQTSFPEQAIAFYLSKSFRILQRYSINGYEIDIFLEDYQIGIEYDGMRYHTEDTKEREQKKDQFFNSQGIKLIRVKENLSYSGIKGNTIYFIPRKKKYLNSAFNEMLQSLFLLLEKYTKKSLNIDIDIIRDELVIREHYASVIKNNSVANIYPELIKEWDVEKNMGMTPDNFSANAHTKVWWTCAHGHSWQATIASRGRGLGCPYCAGQRTIVGINDFESWCKQSHPDLLQEWDYSKNLVKPSEIAKTSNIKIWWRCSKCGYEWETTLPNRVNGTKCPVCYTGNESPRNGVSLYDWCKANDQEYLLNEWDYSRNGLLTPQLVSKGSHKKVWWKCNNGHEWEAQIKSRTYNHGCPYCSGTNKKAVLGKNDLITWCKNNNKQYLLDEWDYEANDGLTPNMFTFGSHKRINWKCEKGHKWSAVIKERTKNKGNMCPECKKNIN